MPNFSPLADRFIERVRAAKIQPTSEVNLVFHARDADGHPLPPKRVCVSEAISLKGMGAAEDAHKLASGLHVSTIVGNINALVRRCPTGPSLMRTFGNQVVTVTRIELEITAP